MISSGDLLVRPAVQTDQRQIANLIHFSPNVHRHLDWRNPLEWIGSPPFYVLETKGEVVAALGCPPEPPSVAWIRLFANSGLIPVEESWHLLSSRAFTELSHKGKFTLAAIVVQDWLRELLTSSGFTSHQSIVMLERDGGSTSIKLLPTEITIRAMMPYDLPAVAEVDASAFDLLWQNTFLILEKAYPQAVWPTVAEREGRLIGYQLSTRNQLGVHLARLAVRPNMQGKGVGFALVADLVKQTGQHAINHLTVNTQSDNTISLTLYQRLGFHETGERYQVYEMQASN
ncbi:MAG: N-acetyltransferase family protein [Anaerolineales bacterium]